MFTAFDFDGGTIESFTTLDNALQSLRACWNEVPDGPQTFIIQDETFKLAHATMVRLADTELCLTVYSDGRTETHRCHYVLDESGRYVRSEVTPVVSLNATQTLTEWATIRQRQPFPAH